MKKMWSEPVIMAQKFMPNEYVAACGDSGAYYIFQCNAPKGTLYQYPESDGSIDGVYTGDGRARKLGSFKPNLSVKHYAKTTDAFYDGFIDYDMDGKPDPGEGVIVWIEHGWDPWWGPTSDYHATKELDMKSWTTSQS